MKVGLQTLYYLYILNNSINYYCTTKNEVRDKCVDTPSMYSCVTTCKLPPFQLF